MQIFFFSPLQTVLLCFLVWPTIQILSALTAMLLPKSFFSLDNPIFKTHKFEQNGKLYERLLLVKRWKRFLPDGSAITGIGLKKKHLSDTTEKGLEIFIVESCKAEFLHALAIPPFILFGLFCPSFVLFFMFLYSVLVNVPCIVAQRYNRPRVLTILKRRSKTKQKIAVVYPLISSLKTN